MKTAKNPQGGGIEQRIPIPVILEKNFTSVSRLMAPLTILTASQLALVACADSSAEVVQIGNVTFIDGSVLSYKNLNQGEKTVVDSIKSDFTNADQSGKILGIDPSGEASNRYQSMPDIIASNFSFSSKENIAPGDLGIDNDGLNVFSLKIGEKDQPVVVYNYEANVEGYDRPVLYSFFFSKNDKGEWTQAAMVDDKNNVYGYLVDAGGGPPLFDADGKPLEDADGNPLLSEPISLSGMLIPQGEDQDNNNFITFKNEGGRTIIVKLDKNGNRLAVGEFPYGNGLFELKKDYGQPAPNTENISFKVGTSATATPPSEELPPTEAPPIIPSAPTAEEIAAMTTAELTEQFPDLVALTNPKNPNSPVFQFARAFGVKPEDVGDLTPVVETDADGKQFIVMTTGDLTATDTFDESSTPLMIAEQGENGEWKMKTSTLDKVAKKVGWDNFGALLVFNENAKEILKDNFGGGIVYIDWNYVQPEKGQWDFSDPEYNVETAFNNGMTVKGNLIWGKGNVADWVKSDPDINAVMVDYITQVMTHYKGKIKIWDVVNESNRKGQDVFWNKLGLQGVRDAFSTARAVDPSATLLYNDFIDVDGTESENRMEMIDQIVPQLQADGNIDGIGIQIIVNRMSTFNPDKLRAQLEILAKYGLPIHVSEFSVVINGENTPENLKKQAKVGGEIIKILKESGIVVDVIAFGVDDNSANKIYGENSNAGFWMKTEDGRWIPKPIVFGMMKSLLEEPQQ